MKPLWIVGVLLVLACGPAKVATGPDALVTPEGLREVEHGTFSKEFARPGTSLSGFRAVRLESVAVEYHHGPYGRPPDEAEKAKVRELVRKALADELPPKHELVSRTGPDVAALRVTVTDIDIRKRDYTGETTGRPARALTVVADLADSESGEILRRFAREDTHGQYGFPTGADPERFWAATKISLHTWAVEVRQLLESDRGL